MARCDCVVRFKNGFVQRCAQEATVGDKCYHHNKYFAGLSSPVEFDTDVSSTNMESVAAVSDSRGNIVSYGN